MISRILRISNYFQNLSTFVEFYHIENFYLTVLYKLINFICNSENALARVQRVHEPADLWYIPFCTR